MFFREVNERLVILAVLFFRRAPNKLTLAFCYGRLNKRIYDDLFAWFERACQQAQFFLAGLKMRKLEEHIIRLLTYLLFAWFLKEKGLLATLNAEVHKRGFLPKKNMTCYRSPKKGKGRPRSPPLPLLG